MEKIEKENKFAIDVVDKMLLTLKENIPENGISFNLIRKIVIGIFMLIVRSSCSPEELLKQFKLLEDEIGIARIFMETVDNFKKNGE